MFSAFEQPHYFNLKLILMYHCKHAFQSKSTKAKEYKNITLLFTVSNVGPETCRENRGFHNTSL